MSDLVSVLDVDSALAELIPPEQRTQARQATAAATITFEASSWQAPLSSDPARGGYGLLVIDGLVLRRAGIEGRHAAELLGPGDLLRPWQHDDGGESTLAVEWSWRVVASTRCAVLDPRWTARAAAYPQLGAELAGRALGRSLRLVTAMAIAQQPRLDERLWMLFWDLADRFGKVHADGVHPRAATYPRGAQPPRGRAPAVGLGCAHAAGRGGPAAPLRQPLDPRRRPAGARELSRVAPRSPRPSGQGQGALLASRRGYFNRRPGSLGRRGGDGHKRGACAFRDRYRA